MHFNGESKNSVISIFPYSIFLTHILRDAVQPSGVSLIRQNNSAGRSQMEEGDRGDSNRQQVLLLKNRPYTHTHERERLVLGPGNEAEGTFPGEGSQGEVGHKH